MRKNMLVTASEDRLKHALRWLEDAHASLQCCALNDAREEAEEALNAALDAAKSIALVLAHIDALKDPR